MPIPATSLFPPEVQGLPARLATYAQDFRNPAPGAPNAVADDMALASRAINELIKGTDSRARVDTIKRGVADHNEAQIASCNAYRAEAGTKCRPPAKCSDCPLRERLSVRSLTT